jgi:hypothetical protein
LKNAEGPARALAFRRKPGITLEAARMGKEPGQHQGVVSNICNWQKKQASMDSPANSE